MAPSPDVSIVIPCHDVDDYVDECVASALRQTHSNIEVIAVDDGSSDTTGARLDAWARSDERVTVIHQPNAGLGAARNVGVAASRGAFVTLLDGDDLLTASAVELMLAAARVGRADIVSGVADRFDSGGRWRAAPYGRLFAETRHGLHVSSDIDLVWDQMACSKLFSRDVVESVLSFPEGVLYEDVEVVMRAHCSASSVSVVATPCYLWRRREGSTMSIT
ncbi:MAG: glycosyltransferase family 2 protein, partial [Actinomycetota bacterium]